MSQPPSEPEYRAGRKQVLDVLLAHPPMSIQELCTALGVTRKPMRSVIQRLLKEGLVESSERRHVKASPPTTLYAPSAQGREIGSSYVPPPARPGERVRVKFPGWEGFGASRLAVVRVVLGADATGLTASGISRLAGIPSNNVRSVLSFGLDRGLVRRAVIAGTQPATYAYYLTPEGIEASESYVRAHSEKDASQVFRVSLEPEAPDLAAALALLEQLGQMQGVTVARK